MLEHLEFFKTLPIKEIKKQWWLKGFISNLAPDIARRLEPVKRAIEMHSQAKGSRTIGAVSASGGEQPPGGIDPAEGAVDDPQEQLQLRLATAVDPDDIEYEEMALHDSSRKAGLTSAALYRTKLKNTDLLYEQLGLIGNKMAEPHRDLLEESLNRNKAIFGNTAKGKLHRFTDAEGNIVYHKVNLEDQTPISKRACRCRPELMKVTEDHINKLVKLGVITPDSTGPWSAPMILVPKPGTQTKQNPQGEYRGYVDLREINKRIKKCGFQMKTAGGIYELMHEAEVFATLDMKLWFHQISIWPPHRKHFNFTTPSQGMYQHGTLPMGYINAPHAAQDAVETIFRVKIPKRQGPPFEGKIALDRIISVYIDDIIIFADIKSHGKVLGFVFTTLHKHHMQLSPDKAHLFSSRIYFLGFYLENGENGTKLHVDPAKVEALRLMPKPHDEKPPMQFLGIVTYQRKFILRMAKNTFHLTNLLKKENEWKWTAECDQEHEYLAKALISPPALALPDYSRTMLMRADACGYGVGCVLGYCGDSRREGHVMAYQSRKLTPGEQK